MYALNLRPVGTSTGTTLPKELRVPLPSPGRKTLRPTTDR
jgi:hypothetical protein